MQLMEDGSTWEVYGEIVKQLEVFDKRSGGRINVRMVLSAEEVRSEVPSGALVAC